MIVYENDEDFEQALDEYLQSSELDERHDVIEQELEKIEPLQMTPIEAINKLYELKQLLKK